MPDDLREVLGDEFDRWDDLEAHGVTSVESLAKSFLDTKEHVARTRSGGIPGEGASSDDWAKFYQGLGAPDSVEGYAVPETKDPRTNLFADKIREKALGIGLTKKQFEELVGHTDLVYQDNAQELQQIAQRANERWVTEGKQRFGDKYEKSVAEASRTLKELAAGDEDLGKILQSTGLASHPKLLEMLSNAYHLSIGDHQVPESDDQDKGPSPEDVLDGHRGKAVRIREIMMDPDYEDRKSKNFHRLREEQKRLNDDLFNAGFTGATDPDLGVDFSQYR